jgi:hypothetical protein
VIQPKKALISRIFAGGYFLAAIAHCDHFHADQKRELNRIERPEGFA